MAATGSAQGYGLHAEVSLGTLTAIDAPTVPAPPASVGSIGSDQQQLASIDLPIVSPLLGTLVDVSTGVLEGTAQSTVVGRDTDSVQASGGVANVDISVAALLSLLPPVLGVSADAIGATAQAACVNGTPEFSGSATLANPKVSVLGLPVTLPLQFPPNTGITVPVSNLANLSLLFNEQLLQGSQFTVNALHLSLVLNTIVAGKLDLDIALGTATVGMQSACAAAPVLILSKIADAAFVRGGVGSYTFIVTNTGGFPAQAGLTLTDVLPSGLTYDHSSGQNWSCQAVGQTVTCSNTATIIQPNGTSTLQMFVDVAGSTPDPVVNTAVVGNPDQPPSDCLLMPSASGCASTSTTVHPVPQPVLSYVPASASQIYGPPIASSVLNATAVDASTNAVVTGSFAYTAALNGSGQPIGLIAGTTVLPAGAYTLTATFTSSDPNYTSGGTATAQYVVTPAPLTLTIVNNPTKAYDGTTTATLAPSNYQWSGFVGTDGATVTQTAGTYAAATPGAEPVAAALAATNFTAIGATDLANYILPKTATGPGTITAASQTITCTVPATAVYGAVLPMNGVASSGLTPVTYTVTGAASVMGSALTITASTGTVTVTANQAGNGSTIGSATQACGTIVLNPAPLTASIIGNPTKTFDGTTMATLTSANYSLSGFVDMDGATVTQTAGAYAAATPGTEPVTTALAATDFTATGSTDLDNYILPTTASGPGTITASMPTLIGGASRKTHGTAGTFDLPLNPSATVDSTNLTVEPRRAEPGDVHRLIFSFDAAVTSVGAVQLSGSATSVLATGTAAPAQIEGNTVTVTLSGVPDRKRLQVTLTDINGVPGADATLAVGYLLGDVTQDRFVTGLDASLVGAKSPAMVTSSNFPFDVALAGAITGLDKAIVGANSPKSLE